jgi:YVTN family beta-propeller protein
VGSEPVQVALTDDSAWVTVSGDAGTIVPLDPDTGKRAGNPVSIGGTPRGIAFADGLLWVSATKANQIVVVDPDSRKVVKSIKVAANPREVRAGEGGVWVTNADTSEVTAIDTGTRKVAGKVKVQGQPFGLGVGDGLVWAAGLDNGLLTPIRPTGG